MSLHLSYVNIPLVFKLQLEHLYMWEVSFTPQFTHYYAQECCQNNSHQKFNFLMMKNPKLMYPVLIFYIQIFIFNLSNSFQDLLSKISQTFLNFQKLNTDIDNISYFTIY